MTRPYKQLPIGYSTLQEIRENNAIYIDKTKHIANLVSSGKYYFLSRPRRFGKSLTINTLKALFEGNKSLFNGLYIEDKWDWQNKHPIIHLSFGSSQSVNAEQTLLQIIEQTLHNTAKHHHIELPSLTLNLQFDALIKALSEKCQQRVVLLIDEYDKPILDVIDQPEKAIRNREILKGVYSTIKDNDAHLRFVFLTGVS
ncbi:MULTISPECIES: AAA family ATPase [Cysteiniphilum]